ncbi:MAG TPA: DUF222 domain-containing protein [Candidatus Dormibacteraeota bacterium]
MDGEGLGVELQALRRVIDGLELAFARQSAAFAATDEYELQGSLGPSEWLRHHCRMSGAAAASAVCAGQRLHAIPETEQALHAGEIGFSHLAMVASTERAVTAARGAAAFDERPLLQQAREHSVSRFRFDCASAREAADAAGFLADHLTAVEWRSLELIACEQGVLIRGRLDPVGAATLRTALEPLAKREGAADTRPRSRRMADAAIELARHGLDAGVLPSIAGQRPHLQVTVTLDSLQGALGAPAGELEHAGPIPRETVQRLACDAEVSRVVFGPGSLVLDAGRSRRVPSPAQRRALVARDQGCVWPGCERPPSWTAAHHLLHWTRDNGPTKIANLVSICHRHHEKVHEEGFRLVLTEDHRVLALPPLADAPRARWSKPWTACDEVDGLGGPWQRRWDARHAQTEAGEPDGPSP